MLKINTRRIIQTSKLLLDARVLGLLVFGVIVLLVTWSGLKVLQTNFELEKKISQLRQREAVQKLENENLKLKNKYLESDHYLELSARRQFGKAAPGERLYLVPPSVALARTVEPPKPAEPAPENQQKTKSKQRQNIDDWMNFLLHRNR